MCWWITTKSACFCLYQYRICVKQTDTNDNNNYKRSQADLPSYSHQDDLRLTFSAGFRGSLAKPCTPSQSHSHVESFSDKQARPPLACLLATQRERYTLTSCGRCSAAVRLDQLGDVYPEEAQPTRNVHNCRGADQGARRSIAEMIEEGRRRRKRRGCRWWMCEGSLSPIGLKLQLNS